MEIKAADVAKLRKMTGAGMMDCKKAIQKRIFRRKPPRGGNIKSGKGSNLPYPLIYLPDSNMQI